MLYCYCVALLLFVSSYVLIVCAVPLPPAVNPIAVDKYIYLSTLDSTPQVADVTTYRAHKTHKKRRSIISEGFEPAIQEIKRLQNYTLDRKATAIGQILF